jgi:hypothetical protein
MEVGDVGAVSFDRFAGFCAILAGVATLLYSVAFVIISRSEEWSETAVMLYSLFQLLGGLLTTAVMVALYNRLREVNPGFALWAMLLGLVGAIGSAIHGAYALANVINPPSADPVREASLPNAVDPRGLLTFGVAGLSLFIMSWLMSHHRGFPKNLAYLGYTTAILMAILYLGRLIILDANSLLIAIPALLVGFILNPAFFIWLGLALRGKIAAA